MMKKVLLSMVLVVIITGINVMNAQSTLIVEDIVFTKISSDSLRTYEVFYNEQPVKGNHKKPPVYHQFKIIGGVIFAAAGTTDFSNIEKPFQFGQNLLANTCIILNKSYHNFVYSFTSNSIKVVNGFPFGEKNLDVYFIPGVNLNSGIFSTSVGIEKKIEAGKNINFFLFTELGKDFISNSKVTLSIGFHVNIQAVIHERKDGEIFVK